MNKKNKRLFTRIIAFLSLISVALLWEYNLILTIVLVALAAFMLLMNKSKQELRIFVYCGLSGALAEVIVVFFGAWTYANPNIIGIPIWLIVLWGIASVFIVRSYLSFQN